MINFLIEEYNARFMGMNNYSDKTFMKRKITRNEAIRLLYTANVGYPGNKALDAAIENAAHIIVEV